jgi:hypothetical protein
MKEDASAGGNEPYKITTPNLGSLVHEGVSASSSVCLNLSMNRSQNMNMVQMNISSSTALKKLENQPVAM